MGLYFYYIVMLCRNPCQGIPSDAYFMGLPCQASLRSTACQWYFEAERLVRGGVQHDETATIWWSPHHTTSSSTLALKYLWVMRSTYSETLLQATSSTSATLLSPSHSHLRIVKWQLGGRLGTWKTRCFANNLDVSAQWSSAKTFKFCPNRKRYILWNHCKRWIHGNNKEPAVKKEILIIASIRSPTAPQPRKWTRRSSTSEEIWGHQSLTGTPHRTATVEAARGFQHVLPVWQFRS